MAGVVVVLALGLLILPFAAIGVRRLWKGAALFGDMPSWWLWGGALWRGYVRALPIGSFAFLILMLGILVGLFVPTTEGCCGFKAPNWYVFPFLISFFGSLALTSSVIFFNRPRLVVPPPLRTQPGALSEWLSSRR